MSSFSLVDGHTTFDIKRIETYSKHSTHSSLAEARIYRKRPRKTCDKKHIFLLSLQLKIALFRIKTHGNGGAVNSLYFVRYRRAAGIAPHFFRLSIHQ